MLIAEIDFCVPADIDEIYYVERTCFEVPWGRYAIARDVEDPGKSVYLKALLRCEIVGYAVLSRNEGTAHLMNIAVLPDFRRMGVASQLMIANEEIALEWGSKRMRLEVRATNRPAREFYDKLGFSFKRRIRRYYVNGDDAFIMLARLPLSITKRTYESDE
ncbi:MAG: ribosomal protein S18-alanine N-acetyltransferase [Synergistaceae bacterium]|jgi:ribosomal-protein-alanine N-acetyltransferase|nr:ribosomal protein S18-alanine N-acetyltransferase [Synergistaceae bacterium]